MLLNMQARPPSQFKQACYKAQVGSLEEIRGEMVTSHQRVDWIQPTEEDAEEAYQWLWGAVRRALRRRRVEDMDKSRPSLLTTTQRMSVPAAATQFSFQRQLGIFRQSEARYTPQRGERPGPKPWTRTPFRSWNAAEKRSQTSVERQQALSWSRARAIARPRSTKTFPRTSRRQKSPSITFGPTVDVFRTAKEFKGYLRKTLSRQKGRPFFPEG